MMLLRSKTIFPGPAGSAVVKVRKRDVKAKNLDNLCNDLMNDGELTAVAETPISLPSVHSLPENPLPSFLLRCSPLHLPPPPPKVTILKMVTRLDRFGQKAI